VADGRAEVFFALGSETFQQRDVDVLAAAEVVMDEPAGDARGTCDVLDGDLVVGAFGEQFVGGVENLIAALTGVEAAVLRRADNGSLRVVGDLSRVC